MAGLDPAIQGHTKDLVVLPWMATSEGGHDVPWYGRVRFATPA